MWTRLRCGCRHPSCPASCVPTCATSWWVRALVFTANNASEIGNSNGRRRLPANFIFAVGMGSAKPGAARSLRSSPTSPLRPWAEVLPILVSCFAASTTGARCLTALAASTFTATTASRLRTSTATDSMTSMCASQPAFPTGSIATAATELLRTLPNPQGWAFWKIPRARCLQISITMACRTLSSCVLTDRYYS